MGDHLEQSRIGAEKMLAEVVARFSGIFLPLSINRLAHAFDQESFTIASEQSIPIGAPDYFDHIPSGAAENGFEFLDDIAIAANWPIEPLQIAVNDEDQVVELFARGERDSPQGFGLV